MNAGMFPLPDARAMGGRKPAGQVRSGFGQFTNFSNVASAAGLAAASSITMPANIRTRVLSVMGRGALRFGMLGNGSASDATVPMIEVWVDGTRIVANNMNGANLSSANATCYAGGGYASGTTASAVLDWIPFESSLEVFFTTGLSGSYMHSYLVDIHQ